MDAIRILGIVAVVAGHVWSGETTRALLYTWHVPLFFLLTGYFWTPMRPFGVELGKRVRTLAIPYLGWLLILGLAFGVVLVVRPGGAAVTEVLRPLLGGTYVGRPFSAFWFVGALFAAALFLRLLQRLPVRAQWLIAVALLAVAYVAPGPVSSIPLGIGTGVTSLVFVLAGVSLRRFRALISRPVVVGCAVLVVSATAIGTGWSAPVDLKQADFGTPIVSVLVAIAISIGLILIAESTVPALGARVGDAIVMLSSVGLMVILSHAAVLWVLATPPEGTIVDFAMALALPWVIALLVLHTPLAPYLIGVPRRRRRRDLRS